MLDHKLEPKAVRRVEVITGSGGRRRFADDEKAGIIEEALVPGRDLSRITLADVLAAVRGGCATGELVQPTWSGPVDDVAGRVEAAIAELTTGTTLSDFLGQAERRRSSA